MRYFRRMRRTLAITALAAGALAAGGCSLQRFAANRIADALATTGPGWGSDDDPRLVGDALPFALKTMESLLAETPRNPRLLLAACRGFTSYAAGWVEPAAEALEGKEFAAAKAGEKRALALDLRAKGYCLRALAARYPDAIKRLVTEPAAALAAVPRAGVELLYWTGAAWGSAISLGVDRPDLVADVPVVRAVFERALALAPDFDHGALDEAMIPLEALPAMAGGSPQRARQRFDLAVELSEGERASPYVTWARTYCVAAQDLRAFRDALAKALAVDPEAAPADRLANRLAQARARDLLARSGELFYADDTSSGENSSGNPGPAPSGPGRAEP